MNDNFPCNKESNGATKHKIPRTNHGASEKTSYSEASSEATLTQRATGQMSNRQNQFNIKFLDIADTPPHGLGTLLYY